jgi:hypothetical protein
VRQEPHLLRCNHEGRDPVRDGKQNAAESILQGVLKVGELLFPLQMSTE